MSDYVLLLFSNKKKRFANYIENKLSDESMLKAQEIKNELGEGWILSSIIDLDNFNGILYEVSEVDISKCILENITKLPG